MAKMIIKGVSPVYDGEYELDEDRAFNAREWNWIKKVSGYMPLTISEGFAGGDPVLFVALAVIAMSRSGKVDRADGLQVAEELAEAPFDGASILLVGDEEAEDVPLALTSEPDGSSPQGSLATPRSTGPGSRTGSAPSDETRPATSLSRSGTS